MTKRQVSEATLHTFKTVRDACLLVLGISLLAIGFWDFAFPGSALSNAVIVIGSVGLSNTVAIILSGLIITAIAVILFIRLSHETVQQA